MEEQQQKQPEHQEHNENQEELNKNNEKEEIKTNDEINKNEEINKIDQKEEIKINENQENQTYQKEEKVQQDIKNNEQSQQQKDQQIEENLKIQSQQQVKKGICLAQNDRKNQSFIQLKKWSEQRNSNFKQHNNISEQLIKGIEEKINASQLAFGEFVQFFKDRCKSETVYVQQFKNIPQTSQIFNKKNTPKEYQNISSNLKQFDEQQKIQQKTHYDLIKFIENDILKNLMLQESQQYEKAILTCKNNIKETKKKLDYLQQDSIKQGQRYTKLYYQQINNDKDSKNKDLYYENLKFVAILTRQIQAHIDFGKVVLALYDNYLKYETIRIQKIQEIIMKYSKFQVELYSTKTFDLNNVQIIFQKQNVQVTDKLQNNINQNELQFIEEQYGLNDDGIRKYLEYMQTQELESEPLLIKQIDGQISNNGIFSSFKKCQIFFTIDHFLLFVEVKPNYDKEIIFCFKIFNVQMILRDQQNIIDLVVISKGLIFNKTSKISVKFDTEDQLTEFKETLSIAKAL